jgi:uncharacterized repeat protein (TIGR03803 family)
MKLRVFTGIAAVSLLILQAMPERIVAQATPKFSVLHTFTGSDGASPFGSLIGDSERNLYGTAIGGGANGFGVVFKVDRYGNHESSLYNFQGGSDGAFPATDLHMDESGNLYGTTRGGGQTMSPACTFNPGCGVVFKVDRHGNETPLYAFSGGSDGYGPSSGVIRDEAGNLYGTTVVGGTSNKLCTGDGPPVTPNCGVVYKVDPKGNETVLYAFTGGSDGYAPYGNLLRDWQGNLYGAASNGGDLTSPFCGTTVPIVTNNPFNGPVNGCGTVFKIAPSGNFSVEHTFEGKDGGPFPDGWFASDLAGNIYGVTGNGGILSGCGGIGCGTIFKIDRHGNEAVLYEFTGAADGASPLGSVIRDREGNLYSTTLSGGDLTDSPCNGIGGCGVVFKLDPWGHQIVLHTFTGGADGANPQASLYMDNEGNLYGTTTAGGDPSCNCGVVFKIPLQRENNEN